MNGYKEVLFGGRWYRSNMQITVYCSANPKLLFLEPRNGWGKHDGAFYADLERCKVRYKGKVVSAREFFEATR